MSDLTKSDGHVAGVRFVNHKTYDYRQNWTTQSPVTKIITITKFEEKTLNRRFGE